MKTPFKVGDTIQRPTGKQLYKVDKLGSVRVGKWRAKGLLMTNTITNKQYTLTNKEIVTKRWKRHMYMTPIKQVNKHKII